MVLALCLAAASSTQGVAFASSRQHPPLPSADVAPMSPPGDMLADERSAVHAVDAFWKETLKGYQSPEVRGGYTGTDGPSCAGKPAVQGNAFYCKPEDFLAWDQGLMSLGYQRIGNAWVYLIIAHEWGHAIQARVQKSRVSQAAELQADCLAGAALTGAVKKGLLGAEPSDAEQIEQTLTVSADKSAWTNTRDHGNARQRIEAYKLGQSRGVDGCFGRTN
jgi:predicted metalloprotease